MVISGGQFFNSRIKQLAAQALQHALPMILPYRDFAAATGILASYERALLMPIALPGSNTGRVLKGEKPADLPVQQATKVELIVNLKTAKALGVTVPTSVLGRADEVIK